MSAWGHGIREDDFVCDILGEFDDLLKAGKNVKEATHAVTSKFSYVLNDPDDGPLFWIALAEAQWTYGDLDSKVLNHVREDFDACRSLKHWLDNPTGMKKRRAALEKFIIKITTPKLRPKNLPKIVVRAPKFIPGDCLSIRLESGSYAAALVLASDHSNVEYGKNLIVVLDFLASNKPDMDVFHARKWLILTHHSWGRKMDIAWYLPVNVRAIKDRIEVVGQIATLDSDPKKSNSCCGWDGIGMQAMHQREWDSQQSK